jgi:hypothetical protein
MTDLLLPFVGTLAALIVWNLTRHYFPGYLIEKGKNLATKEDVAEITRRIEDVKHDYALVLEAQKQKGQLRFAALDRRLEVAQQAHICWWNLLRSLYTPEIKEEVQKCQEFWVNNRLYLSEEVSFAFRRAYMAASHHEALKEACRYDPTQSAEVRENFKRITEAENTIVRSVAIPPLNEGVSISEELKKQA